MLEGPGAPRIALRADTGTRSIELRIWCEKIMLIFHISCLEDGELAKDMLEEQVANNWPGLATEVDELVKMLRIDNPKDTQLSKKAYEEEIYRTYGDGETKLL